METYFYLFISALVSLHQYIPADQPGVKKYYQDVRQIRQTDVLHAANQSCRFLYSVSRDAGLESLGSGGALSSLANSLLENSGGMDVMIAMIDTPEMEKRMADRGISPRALKDFLGVLCAEDFNPYLLPPTLAQQSLAFLEQEIKILDKQQMSSLGQFKSFGTVVIHDKSGESLDLYGVSDRQWVPYHDMAKTLSLSLLATEDDQFFSHQGVHPRAVARILKEATSSDEASGGSTVTMQLLKNMFFESWPKSQYAIFNHGQEKKLLRKVREWYWAKPFEENFKRKDNPTAHKQKVLELYFNLVNFGSGIQGISQAAQFYFAKPPKDLSLSESAFLTSLLKRPAFYAKPRNYVSWTKPRRDDYILERVGELCRNPKSQSSLVGAVALVDLCKASDADRMSLEDLEKIKSEPLPLWQPYVFNDLVAEDPIAVSFMSKNDESDKGSGDEAVDPRAAQTEAFAPFITKANQLIKATIAAQPGFHRDLNVQTTVVPELQKIVYNVVRKKLDAYDSSRQARELLEPALDDRGRRATLRSEDLGVSFLYNIRRFTKSQWTRDEVLLFSVGLSTRGEKLFSLTTSEVEGALRTLSKTSDPSRVKQIISEVRKQTNQVGEVLFVRVTADDTTVLTLGELIADMDFDAETQAEVQSYYASQSVKQRLFRTSIQRMLRYRPRNSLELLIRTEDGVLLDEQLKPISMTNSDRWWAMHLAQGRTTFFWAKRLGTREGRTRYQLETPSLQAAVMIVDSNNGEVLANFAGYEPENSFFDRSSDMRRPYGSSLKPWVYHHALDNGLSPYSQLNNWYVEFPYAGGERTYRPKNFSGGSPSHVTLEEGMVHSYNKATFSLFNHPDWDGNPSWYQRFQELRELFNHIGLYEETQNFMPIVLGAQESTLQRLVDSYTYFANGKAIQRSHFIKKIEDYYGRTLYEHQPESIAIENKRSTTTLEVQNLLAGVANRGTAGRLRWFTESVAEGRLQERCFKNRPRFGEQSCFGGKTGTSNDGRDTWFTGISKNFVIGVWVGYDAFRPIPGKATGGQLALPIFMDIVKEGIDILPRIEPFFGVDQIVENQVAPRPLFDSLVVGNNASELPLDQAFTQPLVFDQCRCDALVSDQSGAILGYKLIDSSNLSYISETYNTLDECQVSKNSLLAAGVIQCQ